ncbi:alpha/beta hydrolase family esterase [Falsiroseomonas sp. HW251]|uniref:alpha/beta hydrolase family esterase n=1 Tax=Falsiroseomonas sp. HW251 TaxID=3390998 RepID=UPI003D3111E8
MEHAPRRLRLAVLLMLFAVPALACGPDTDCVLGERTYRIRMPDHATGPVGAIVFAHGAGGKASDIMEDEELAQAVSGLGLALIAPQAAPGRSWRMRRTEAQPPGETMIEIEYLDRMMADAASRFPIDRSRVMMSGMSAGGMLTWYVACYRRDAYAGFAPIAGTFWTMMPTDCGAPPSWMRHIHGRQDQTVPLAGRTGRGGARQGNVHEAMAMLASAGGFGPPRQAVVDGQDCEIRGNGPGQVLELCLHDGGHDYRVADIVSAWRALAAYRGW